MWQPYREAAFASPLRLPLKNVRARGTEDPCVKHITVTTGGEERD